MLRPVDQQKVLAFVLLGHWGRDGKGPSILYWLSDRISEFGGEVPFKGESSPGQADRGGGGGVGVDISVWLTFEQVVCIKALY